MRLSTDQLVPFREQVNSDFFAQAPCPQVQNCVSGGWMGQVQNWRHCWSFSQCFDLSQKVQVHSKAQPALY